MTTFDVNAILSSTAYGSDGDKIGKVEQVFLDDNTEEVTFVTVNTGLFGTKESFVPADGAQQDGDRLVLPYTKDVVKDAPNVDADQHLSPAEEEEIYRYYKMNYSGTGGRDDRDATETDRSAAPAAGTAGYTRNDRYTDETADRHDTAARAELEPDAAGRFGNPPGCHWRTLERVAIAESDQRIRAHHQQVEAGNADHGNVGPPDHDYGQHL